MNVYILEAGSYDHRGVEGVYGSAEAAMAAHNVAIGEQMGSYTARIPLGSAFSSLPGALPQTTDWLGARRQIPQRYRREAAPPDARADSRPSISGANGEQALGLVGSKRSKPSDLGHPVKRTASVSAGVGSEGAGF